MSYSVDKWHNIRYYYTNGRTVTDFELTVEDAVDTGVFENRGVLDLVKVEWCGPAGPTESSYWKDITALYKAGYHERTHYVS
jgi:hypothetical protein